jgi:O-antigen ligase
MRFLNKILDPITITQYLVIGGLVSIAISPPLANLFIGLSLIATLSIRALRNQLFDFFKTKLGYACIAFILVIFSGLFYGIETNNVIASSIWGWRKFLMLPIAAAIFMNAPQAKQQLIISFWITCLILAFYSWAMFIEPTLTLSEKHSGGIVVRNYATQGLFFSMAAIIAFANTLNRSFPNWFRTLSCLTIPLFIFNIAQISIGRSGYVALIVMANSFVFLYFTKVPILKKMLLCLIMFAALAGTLASTTSSQQRIALAKTEFQSGINAAEETSIGVRLSFWKNTIEMIPGYFFLGTGTGGFEKAYAKQVQEKIGAENVVTGDPHNQYLKLLIEHGPLGLIIFLSIIFLLLKQKSSSPFRPIGVAALFAICATSLVNSHFSTFNEGQFIWILTGSLLASENFAGQKTSSTVN